MSRNISTALPIWTAPRGLPVRARRLDHYTLIVPDAVASARYHVEVLGFRMQRIQPLNVGSAPQGEYDMLNYVLELPDNPGCVMVVTEGLTKESIFHRYMERYGAGVHHIAYEVDDIQASFDSLRESNIPLTSDHVLNDPLSGLRQVFLDRKGPGYFIELIERTEVATSGKFVDDNMMALARTMNGYLTPAAAPAQAPAPSRLLKRAIRQDAARVVEFLVDPANLPKWTGHQTVRCVSGRWIEIRRIGDVDLDIEFHSDSRTVLFRWSFQGQSRQVGFKVLPEGEGHCRVEVELPPLPPERLAPMAAIIEAELVILAALMEGEPDRPELAPLREKVDQYHLDVYQRRQL
ncbi:VOC family protein [Hyalangium rubrum]|uniref:VOC family protein n=1 Tax=Hyalangium rubrum TaxID=3103134 RepID=A0ABU5H7V2_9BACT|nr:VOC family protein [Hyalangium sp. s54d21]MDY7229551.1 VOC family protein [Hyalangium sp. s54d21]